MKKGLSGGVLAAVAWLAVTAAPAPAAFIYTRGGATTQQYVYANFTNTGEMSVVVVTETGGNYRFVESGPGVTIHDVDFRCTLVSSTEATCPITDTDGLFFSVDAELHDATDSLDMRTTSGARIEGGDGSDVLRGGSAGDLIIGGESGVPATDGNDFIDGRGGADHVLGDGGVDTMSYASRSTAVNVSLDDVANDGGFGEGDNVRSDVENLRGTSAGDTLKGSVGANKIEGLGGFDEILGLGGPDQLFGGDTADHLEGGAGIDSLAGEAGGDRLLGGTAGDSIDGGTDDDAILGGDGPDDMFGGAGGADEVDYAGVSAPLTVTAADDAANDGTIAEGDNVHSDIERIFGGSGNDRLTTNGLPGAEAWGRSGGDTLLGHNEDDRLEGGIGDDTLDGRFGGDVMNGGSGVDTVDYSDHWFTDDETGDSFGVLSLPDGIANDGNGQIDFAPAFGTHDNVGSDIENVIGTPAPDVLEGTNAVNQLIGAGEDDQLDGGGAGDELDGGEGADDIDGGRGGDDLLGEAGDDLLDGGEGADVFAGGPDEDTADYSSRNAALAVTIGDGANDGEVATGEADDVDPSVEDVIGGSGPDVLGGGFADNRLVGGGGDDTLDGFFGADFLVGGQGSDTIDYSARGSAVAVTLDGVRNDGFDLNGDGISTAAEEGDRDVGIENATGGTGPDFLKATIADTVRNVLRGLGDNDTLITLDGTATIDVLNCGGGASDQFGKDPADTQTGCEIPAP